MICLYVEFYENACGCSKADGKPCSMLFHLDHYEELRTQSYIMTHDELDHALMGSLRATMHNQETLLLVVGTNLSRGNLFHALWLQCMETFGFLYGIGESKLKAIKKHYVSTKWNEATHS